MHYLRFRDLKTRGIVRNRPTLKNWVSKYGFPRGRLIGNARLWSEQEVDEWIASRPSDTKPAPANILQRLEKARAARQSAQPSEAS
jgi:predicted DNA-binding transcriptional regulator AlpA